MAWGWSLNQLESGLGQWVRMKPVVDLFSPNAPEERLDPLYLSLLRSPAHQGTRQHLNAAFARMGDPDGVFASNFWGPAFHARLFEITCFLYLEASGFALHRAHRAPDFIAYKAGFEIAVEATTSNPPDGANRNIGATELKDLPIERIIEKSAVEFPRRMTAALWRKVAHAYHREPHVAGKPLVLMVQPAFEAGANFYIDDALVPALFGDRSERQGLFDRDEVRHVSAIAYCNNFTVSKVSRLACPAQFRTEWYAIREGFCLVEGTDEPWRPKRFRFEVGHPDTPQEAWPEGVTLFLNPNAAIPLPPDSLEASCIIRRDTRGRLIKCISGFHPVAQTMIATPRS